MLGNSDTRCTIKRVQNTSMLCAKSTASGINDFTRFMKQKQSMAKAAGRCAPFSIRKLQAMFLTVLNSLMVNASLLFSRTFSPDIQLKQNSLEWSRIYLE